MRCLGRRAGCGSACDRELVEQPDDTAPGGASAPAPGSATAGTFSTSSLLQAVWGEGAAASTS
eukprot:11373830-Alexandrium_andersonii.AAC.1